MKEETKKIFSASDVGVLAELAYINAEVSELKTIFTKKADLDRLVLLEEKVAKLEKMVMEK